MKRLKSRIRFMSNQQILLLEPLLFSDSLFSDSRIYMEKSDENIAFLEKTAGMLNQEFIDD